MKWLIISLFFLFLLIPFVESVPRCMTFGFPPPTVGFDCNGESPCRADQFDNQTVRVKRVGAGWMGGGLFVQDNNTGSWADIPANSDAIFYLNGTNVKGSPAANTWYNFNLTCNATVGNYHIRGKDLCASPQTSAAITFSCDDITVPAINLTFPSNATKQNFENTSFTIKYVVTDDTGVNVVSWSNDSGSTWVELGDFDNFTYVHGPDNNTMGLFNFTIRANDTLGNGFNYSSNLVFLLYCGLWNGTETNMLAPKNGVAQCHNQQINYTGIITSSLGDWINTTNATWYNSDVDQTSTDGFNITNSSLFMNNTIYKSNLNALDGGYTNIHCANNCNVSIHNSNISGVYYNEYNDTVYLDFFNLTLHQTFFSGVGGATYGIDLENVSNAKIEGLTCINASDYCMFGIDTDNVTVKDLVTISSAVDGSYWTRAQNMNWTNITSLGHGDEADGFEVSNASGTINGVFINGTLNRALRLFNFYNSTVNNVFINGTELGGGESNVGIQFGGVQNVSMNNITCYSIDLNGCFWLDDSDGVNTNNVTVTDFSTLDAIMGVQADEIGSGNVFRDGSFGWTTVGALSMDSSTTNEEITLLNVTNNTGGTWLNVSWTVGDTLYLHRDWYARLGTSTTSYESLVGNMSIQNNSFTEIEETQFVGNNLSCDSNTKGLYLLSEGTGSSTYETCTGTEGVINGGGWTNNYEDWAGSYTMNGLNADEINFSNSPHMYPNSTNWSFCTHFMYNDTNIPGDRMWVSSRYRGTEDSYLITVEKYGGGSQGPDNTVMGFVRDNGVSTTYLIDGGSLKTVNDKKYHWACITYNADTNNLSMFVDDVLTNSTSATLTLQTGTNHFFINGNKPTLQYALNGSVDVVFLKNITIDPRDYDLNFNHTERNYTEYMENISGTYRRTNYSVDAYNDTYYGQNNSINFTNNFQRVFPINQFNDAPFDRCGYDWNINTTLTKSDENITQCGNITIYDSGNLTLDNVTLQLNNSAGNATSNIFNELNGLINFTQSNITSITNRYFFRNVGSSVYLDGGGAQGMGLPTNETIEIYDIDGRVSDCIVNNYTVTGNLDQWLLIMVNASYCNITNNEFINGSDFWFLGWTDKGVMIGNWTESASNNNTFDNNFFYSTRYETRNGTDNNFTNNMFNLSFNLYSSIPVQYNYFYNNTFNSSYIQQNGSTFENNRFYSTSLYALNIINNTFNRSSVFDPQSSKLENNIFDNCGSTARCHWAANISNNNSYYNSYKAIEGNLNAYEWEVTNSYFNNTNYSMVVRGNSTLLSKNNVIENPKEGGVYLRTGGLFLDFNCSRVDLLNTSTTVDFGVRPTPGDSLESYCHLCDNYGDKLCDYNQMWYVDILTQNMSGNIVEEANVTLKNVSGITVFSLLTNSTGQIERQNVTEKYVYYDDATFTVNATNHTLWAFNDSVCRKIWAYDFFNLSTNYNKTFNFTYFEEVQAQALCGGI